MFYSVISIIILPPAINFIFFAIGLLIGTKNQTISRFFLYSSGLSLVLFSFNPFADFMIKSLEIYPPLTMPIKSDKEQAIVVLSAGNKFAKEFNQIIDKPSSLERANYAAFLYKQTKLPILVSGGMANSQVISEAKSIANLLTDFFYINVKWLEEKSLNTYENAVYSTAILKENGIKHVFLITHAYHMSRAVSVFRQQNLAVTPAPTIFTKRQKSISYYIPSVDALYKTKIALKEYIGMLWYKFTY